MEVGIDVGGTRTRILVSDGGDAIWQATAPTASWRHGTLFCDEENATRLLALIPNQEAVGRADTPIVVGAHGVDNRAQCELLTSWLAKRHPGKILVLNDSELFGPAVGVPKAINVVAGTGSIVVGRDADGELIKVGGYGWTLGDPGAAPSLVREAVIAIMEADDEGQPVGALARSLMAHYGSPDPVALGYDFTADAGITNWGSLAPLVFTAAELGDALAIRVIEADGAQLANDVITLRGKGVTNQTVVAGGGVITAQPRLEIAFTSALRALDPALDIRVLRDAPVKGALALAKSLRAEQEFPKEGKEQISKGVNT